METIQIAFEIQATCHQRVKIIDKDWSEEKIIAGLRSGSVVTSTWINEGRGGFVEELSGNVIAEVISQEIDGEYLNFR